MIFVMPFLLAMVFTMAGLPVFGRYAHKWHIVDLPGERKVHSRPVPRIGGFAMALGVLVAAVIVIPLETSDRYFLIACGLLTAFGGLDDRFDLDYRIKLLGQVLAALIVIFGGDVQIHALTLDDRMPLPEWVSVPFTLFFLVGVTNAINLADGLDGLAGGTTFLCLCALAMLAYSGGQLSCAALALAFGGAVLGFLRYNTYPASVFMGDAGSQLLGFAVGVLSLRATQGGNSVVSAATPILLLALPILDTLSVMAQRISEGRSPFSADKNHIHHKLLSFGFDHHEAVMVIYAVQADLFILAYWMRYESDFAILGVVTLFFGSALLLLQAASRRHWRFRARRDVDTPLVRMITTLREPKYLPRWSYMAIAWGIGAYGLIVTVATARLSGDVRLLLMALLGVIFIWLGILRVKPLSVVEKAALYITATVLVYLDSLVVHDQGVLAILGWAAVSTVALGTLVRLRLRLRKDRSFELTPLDVIVLFVALVVPSLPGLVDLPNGGALGIAKLVILFYAIETLVSRVEMPTVWLRLGVGALLVGLIVRPLL